MKKYILSGLIVGLMASCTMTRPYTATNNSLGDKTGVSKTTLIFGSSSGDNLGAGLIVTNKKFGVIEAAKKGGIDKIGAVDVKTTNYLFFSKVEIIVSGE
jgi:hypothetical protein